MLLTNRLNFFDKQGNEINLQPESAVTVEVIDPTNSGGYGATFNVYTSRDSKITCLEIVTGGENYDATGQAYLMFKDSVTETVWNTDPIDLTVDPISGAILNFTGYSASENLGFSYPAVTWKGEMYFDMVSTGLVESQDIFVVEQVFVSSQPPDKIYRVFPRADEGPSIGLASYENSISNLNPANDNEYGVGVLTLDSISVIGNVIAGQNLINGIVSTVGIQVGMLIFGTGIASGTTVISVSTNSIEISTTPISFFPATNLEFYLKHGYVADMKVKVSGTLMNGVYDVTSVSDTKIFIKTLDTIGNISVSPGGIVNASPVWRGRVVGLEEEIFMFTVEYREDYPVITKNTSVIFDPTDGTAANDFVYANTTANNAAGQYQRRLVSNDVLEKMMHFHLGFSAGTEGSYIKLFVLEDITYPYAPVFVSQISLRGEAESEDVRLEALLQNFGRGITQQQETILRDTDVYETLTDYRLLNRKRKEMLLEGDQIWPYLGSYKGLVNIVNWFGYYDLRIKEYWLNVNKEDVYFGKYKQIQIPFQLEERGVPSSSIDMLPSNVYKKTNKFGLFYDLNKENGVLDENGVPVTIDAFQFSNEEILIKLFALKQYLINNFLPLNTEIVDIVGEGVYYERYAANTWNDRVDQTVINLTRSIDFKYTNDSDYLKIVDARIYDRNATAFVPDPGSNKISGYYNTHTIKGVTISSSSSFNRIPTLSAYQTASSPSTVWNGQAFVKAVSNPLFGPSTPGINYSVGDIITLGGGSFSLPIRVRVLATNPATGSVSSCAIDFGLNQGSRYTALPEFFFQTYVQSADFVNNLYYSGIGTGFTLNYTIIQYEVEGVKTTTQGKGYSTLEPIQLFFTDPITGLLGSGIYNWNLKTLNGPYVGYFNQGARIEPLTNEPNIPVGAFLELEALGFDAYWNDLTFRWSDLYGANEAELKAYIDALPLGSGNIQAIEIIDPGSGYTQYPAVLFTGGSGIGATGISQLTDGKLTLLEYTSAGTNVVSPTVTRLNISFSITPIPFSLGAMVTGSLGALEIPKPSVITFIDPLGTYIDVTGVSSINIAGSFIAKIHQGARLTSGGSGYTEEPSVRVYGGHATSLFTWNEIGRGNFYEMTWKITSEPGTAPFNYTSGQKSIDALLNHSVVLPYKGFYKVELIVYDTENNYVNEIKRNYVEAYLPEASPGLVTRFIGPSYQPGEPHTDGGSGSDSNYKQLEQNCVDTWDEAFYHWDEFWGRWINPIKTWTTWNDSDVEWDTLMVSPLSLENNWSYPTAPNFDIYKVSAYDDLIGPVGEFIPAILRIVVFPTVSLSDLPELRFGDTIFLRRDDLVVQLLVDNVTIALPNILKIDIQPGSVWPDNFEANPTAWEVLREVANTFIVKDDLYTPENGKTLAIGQFVTLNGTAGTPLNNTRWGTTQPPYRYGNPIANFDGFYTIFLDAAISLDPLSYQPYVNGQIYQFRTFTSANGHLQIGNIGQLPLNTVAIEPLDSPTEETWGNRTMFYINNTVGSPFQTNADPLKEVRAGFTEFTLNLADFEFSLNGFSRSTPLSTNVSSTFAIVVGAEVAVPGFLPPPQQSIISNGGNGGPFSLNPFLAVTSIDPALMSSLQAVLNFAPDIVFGLRVVYQLYDRLVLLDAIGDMYWYDSTSSIVSYVHTNSTGGATFLSASTEHIYAAYPGFVEIYSVADFSLVATVPQAGFIPDSTLYVPTSQYIVYVDTAGSIFWWMDADPLSAAFGTFTHGFVMPAAMGSTIVYVPTLDAILAFSTNGSGDAYIWPADPADPIGVVTLANAFVGPYAAAISGAQTALWNPAENTVWVGCNSAFVGDGGYAANGFTFNAADFSIVYDIPQFGAATDISVFAFSNLNQKMYAIHNTPGASDMVEYDLLVPIVGTAEILYQQHFRTINMYEDSSNTGHPHDIWNEAVGSKIICVEAVTIDGKKWDQILEKLTNNYVPFTRVAWIDYKYDVFPTRTVGVPLVPLPGFLNLELDFNTRPPDSKFTAALVVNPADITTGLGWYYDYAISYGNFSQEIVNVGEFLSNPSFTLVTVKDPTHELYMCDSTFLEVARDFDEDFAETHLGVKLGWYELSNLHWDAMCSQTWNTVDWPYDMYPNFRLAMYDDTLYQNVHSLVMNGGDPIFIDTVAASSLPEAMGAIVDILNNNFNPSSGIIGNQHPDFSKFYYTFNRSGTPIYSSYYTWGNPAIPKLFGDSSYVASIGSMATQANHINPGFTASVSVPGAIDLTSTGFAGFNSPWIVQGYVSVNLTFGSNKVTNIVGYDAHWAQGGWLFSDNTGQIIGEFGPNIGPITIENGFVTSVTIDQPASFSGNFITLDVYPHRSGLVNFVDIAENTDFFITAFAKTPGADNLGYLTSSFNMFAIANHLPIQQGNTSITAHTYPVGNYYNWVRDLDIFYGGGLENSTLQFAQQYRHIQTYIYEGGNNLSYTADGGGWYPSINWGSYGDLYSGAEFLWQSFVGQNFAENNQNVYRPVTQVRVFDDISGIEYINPDGGTPYLVLNTWFDGFAQLWLKDVVSGVYAGQNIPFDITNSIPYPGGIAGTDPVNLRIEIVDTDGDGQSQIFNCVAVDPFRGVLGKSAVYFEAAYTHNPIVIFDPNLYLLTNIVVGNLGMNNGSAISMMYPGMHLAEVTNTSDIYGKSYNYSAIIDEIYYDEFSIKTNIPRSVNYGSGTNIELIAYTALDLNLKLQPMNSKIWSRTKQSDSMKLLYESSVSAAFTWEDTTISLREKKIPVGASVLFTSDSSDIAGKTKFLWSLYYEGKKVCSTIDENLLWSFIETGLYDLELTITDTNGNTQTKYSTNFVEVYMPE